MSPDPRRSCFEKKRYPTEQLAKKVQREAAAKRGYPLRRYSCDFCFGWHLTKLVEA